MKKDSFEFNHMRDTMVLLSSHFLKQFELTEHNKAELELIREKEVDFTYLLDRVGNVWLITYEGEYFYDKYQAEMSRLVVEPLHDEDGITHILSVVKEDWDKIFENWL